MKPTTTLATALALTLLCAPAVQALALPESPGAVDAILRSVGNVPPVADYCDPRHHDPNNDFQHTYCGAWSAYYVLSHWEENVTLYQSIRKTVHDGQNAVQLAQDCFFNYNQPKCPYKLDIGL